MPGETVMLLHGQGRTRASLLPLAVRLRQAGYLPHLFGYHSSYRSLDQIKKRLCGAIERRVGGGTYHLLGHSLGNVIIRYGFRAGGYPTGLGRIVMLAPPNRPAAMAHALKDRWLYRVLTGEAGQMLADPEFYADLPVPTVPFGVIAGSRDHTGFHTEPSDGVVTVADTRLEGMSDWAEVPHTHTFMMNARRTFDLAVRFLRDGSFGGNGA